MKRFLTVGAFLALGLLLTILSFVGRNDRTSRENMIQIREQTPTQSPGQTLNRGRIGSQAPAPVGAQTWTGILVDAGCPNRDAVALSGAPAGTLATEPGGGAHGTAVSGQTLDRERSDAMAQQVPDLRARNADPSCAVTALTRGFALYLPDGALKNLDEGGNTMAVVVFEGSPQGQAVVNGKSLGEKPRASVKGVMQGDRIIVQDIRLL
jgi:hypothetical protein